MPTIDRDDLLNTTLGWLPQANTLTDQQLLTLAEQVISRVGDDTEHKPRIYCETLRSAAEANKALSSVNSNNVKRHKSYMEEIEWFDSGDANVWDAFLDSLNDLCPIAFGYTGLRSKGASMIKINVADPIEIPCGSVPYGRRGYRGCYDDC